MNARNAIDEFYTEEEIERIVRNRSTYRTKRAYIKALQEARAKLRRVRARGAPL